MAVMSSAFSAGAKHVLLNVPQKFMPGRPLHVALTLTRNSPQMTTVRVSLMSLTNATYEIVSNEANLEPGEMENMYKK
ncbi:hypothetical protein ElyMa_003202200 [Elysia marginata]|uniref:GAE domain-containing protein n=1 Tax=Elysia marginata TaxID=1093978 RepID=A0AAV4J2X7_9GAST|nr:hypothetical protein ElyMa_003202200 [Elysia marginata]